MLRKWLHGYLQHSEIEDFVCWLQQFPEVKVERRAYRGLSFSQYPQQSKIENQKICSWSTDKNVAEYFASHQKYGFVLEATVSGWDIRKILEILRSRNQLDPRLKNYRTSGDEFEILAPLNVNEAKFRRVGIR